jgi:hypothetical protein
MAAKALRTARITRKWDCQQLCRHVMVLIRSIAHFADICKLVTCNDAQSSMRI